MNTASRIEKDDSDVLFERFGSASGENLIELPSDVR